MTIRIFMARALLLSFALPREAAAGWEWQWSNPRPTGNNLIKAVFQDSLRGVVIADNGETAETRDGGETWALRPGRIPSNNLVSATTRDGNLILAGAIDGKVWKSSDGGRTWRSPYQANGSLYDIGQCGPRGIVAVGAEDMILVSEDQGETWSRPQWEEFAPDLLGLHCGEEGFAMAVGEAGKVLKSRDNGKTWVRLPVPDPEVDFTGVVFTDSSRGYATTAWGKVLDTRDGGLTWKSTPLDTLSFFRGIRANGLNLTITGSDGGIWKSLDGGKSWNRALSGTPHYLAASALTGDRSEIVIGNFGTILSSPDDGVTWNARQAGTVKEIQGLATLSATTWVAFGSEGLVMKTRDRGRTWKESSLGDNIGIRAASFLGPVGLLTTFQGDIFRSGDSGETWVETPVPANRGRLFGAAWCDAETALAVGDSGTLLRSADGGESWNLVTGIAGLTDQTLSAVVCQSSGAALIAGYRGLILRSSDKGATWKTMPTQSRKDLFALSFWDASHGLAAGADGIVHTTRDGGDTWTAGTTGSGDDYTYSVAWLGQDTAVLVSEWLHYSRFRMTTDGGRTWEELPLPTDRMLWAISPLDSGRVAVMGQQGSLLLGGFQDATSGIRRLPVANRGHAHLGVSRMGTLPMVRVTLPASIRHPIHLAAYTLGGKLLRQIFSGLPPDGRQPWLLPFPPHRGPVVFRLQGSGQGKSPDLTSILHP